MSTLRSLARWVKNCLCTEAPVKRYRKAGAVIGSRVAILDEVIIDSSHAWHIQIGDDVTLAPRVHILAHDASTKHHLNYTRLGKVTIGNRVFIGASTIVLPGVNIGEDVIIGAGSVVTRDIPSGSVAMGNPAKVVCSLESYLSRKRDEMAVYPCFGRECIVNATDAVREDMNRKMKDRYGFII